MEYLLFLIPVFPLIGALINGTTGYFIGYFMIDDS